MHAWEDVITELDREVIARGGYGKTRGLGVRPALLLIDCQYNHIGADRPILEQLDEWPAGGGEAAWNAVRTIESALPVARASGAPIIYTRYCYSANAARFDAFASKRGRNLSAFMDGSPGTAIVKELAPSEDDLIIDKVHASAFHATALLGALISLNVDTLLIAGVSTSGCVRATAIDAASNNFNVAVIADAVADRIALSHKASLLDLWMKYTDVITSTEAIAYLNELAGLTKRP